MNYNIEGNIFYNTKITIESFGSENGCTVTVLLEGDKNSDPSASMTLTNEVPPIDRTDEAIYKWVLEQLEKYKIK